MDAMRLQSLAGTAAPEDVVNEAGRVTRLPKAALEQLWTVVEPCVTQPMTDKLGTELNAFCRQFEIAEADLGHVVRIVCFLLRHAAAVDLSEQGFAADLETLWPGATELHELLRKRYGPIKSQLREGMLRDALVQHGKVLVDVDWRVDHVVASKPAPRLSLPVAIVTLRYRSPRGPDHVTLQLTSSQLASVSQVFGALAQQIDRLRPAEEPSPAGSTDAQAPAAADDSSDS